MEDKSSLAKFGASKSLTEAAASGSAHGVDCPITDICSVNPESLGSGSEQPAQFRYLDISSINQGVIDWSVTRVCSRVNAPSRAQRVVRSGDVLLSTVRPGLKAHGIIRALVDLPLVASTGFAVLRPHQESDSAYLFHQLFGNAVASQLRAREVGSNYPAVNERDVEALRLFASSAVQQERIGAVLDLLDEAFQQSGAVIAKLKQLRTGLLHDLLTCGIDENGELRDPLRKNHEFRSSQIGLIPTSWEVERLEAVASVDRGKFTYRPRNDPSLYGGSALFIQTGDVTEAAGEVIFESTQTLNQRGMAHSREFPAGTVAITIAANIGDTAILGRPMYFPDSVVGVIANDSMSARWIELCLRRAKAKLMALAPQSAQRNINLRFLRPLEIPIPSLDEQQRCSSLYELLNQELQEELLYLNKLKLVKAGLADNLLNGHVRVPDRAMEVAS
ncbi:restriction endonuclease subunit S [Thiorhodovibrio frisius]|uniref:Restriction endonuclease S subunit n=1 Tax=Thiorhodovibrio frisius TaxID=631362 RepID=H8Z0P1_9GAMM|nr:restriction endonuclease subunit S [Thiorhodovibrio frisius]EIC22382.1 restriction endonuclease S subunit [Thiorhodovibrio frisius]WPL24680.1 Type I restriction modification DNA specificity domain protein [Thiorhodovibrio frisius]